jgi:hypothetical protein
VATDYEHKADDGHYITALIVDPVSVKKVEAGVLKGFSIGIRSPRVIRDAKASGGRIVGGQIVEVSVVDRPANSNAKMTIAKAVDGELVEVAQEFSERPTPASIASVMNKYSEDQERDESGRFGSGGGGSSDGAQSPFTSMEQQREFEGRRFDRQQRVALTGHVNRAERAVTQIRQDARKEGNQEALKETEKAQDALDNARGAMSYTDGGLDYAGTAGALQEASNHAENAVNYLKAGSDYSDRVLNDVREANQQGQAIASFAYDKRPKSADADLAKYSEDQERDDSGRFGSGGGSSSESNNSGSGDRAENHSAMTSRVDEARNYASTIQSQAQGQEARALGKDVVERMDEAVKAHEAGDYEKAVDNWIEARSLATGVANATAEATAGRPGGGDATAGRLGEAVRGLGSALQDYGDLQRSDKSAENTDSGKSTTRIDLMSNIEIANKAAGLLAEIKKFDEKMFNNALTAIGGLISVEGKQAAQGHDERESIKDLLKSLKHLIHFYRGEAKEGEVTNPILALLGDDDSVVLPETNPAEILMAADGDKKENPFAKEGEKEKEDKDEPEKDEAKSEESTDEESDDKMNKADMCEKCDKSADECKCADKSVLSDPETAMIIEKAVKSARIAVEEELELLKSANVQLEAERDEALNKAASGGPVRSGLTTKNSKHNVSDLLEKATDYRAKAANTEDRLLSAGYLELAEDLESKAKKA